MGLRLIVVLLTWGVSWLACPSGPRAMAEMSAPMAAQATSSALQDASVKPFQIELLEMAFEAASAMPVVPHIKNRSRNQEAVVRAMLELGLPRLAEKRIDGIDNWRRGAGYAALGVYCVKRGMMDRARQYLAKAERVRDDGGDWTSEQLTAQVAELYAMLGEGEKARQVESTAGAIDRGRSITAEGQVTTPEAFEAQVAALDSQVALGVYDVSRNAAAGYVLLWDRYYQDAVRRQTVEGKLRSVLGKFPVWLQMEILVDLSLKSATHDDKAAASGFLGEAEEWLTKASWWPRDEVAWRSRLVKTRVQIEDRNGAREAIERTLARYGELESKLQNYERAGAIRPLAEAYAVMGDRSGALALYSRIVSLGVVNPNLRPRTDDFVANCCSLAAHAVEPDGPLWGQLREIHRGLKQP